MTSVHGYNHAECMITFAEEGGCFYFGLFVCLSFRRMTEKVVNGFRRNFLEAWRGMAWPRDQVIKFGDDPDNRPDPGVRNPDSLDYRKST